MREILFRGKRVIDGVWLYGYYYSKKNKHFIINAGEIDPKTLGEFTGLTDKNGKKIFEGDIIRFMSNLTGSNKYGVVNYDTSVLAYCLQLKESNPLLVDINPPIEVIGNVFDNEELLK